MFENVDGRTDARVIGILIAHLRAFGSGELKSVRLRLSVTLSPPKPLDKIQPNLVCELLTCLVPAMAHFFGPAPWGGAKRSNIIKYH